MDDDERRELVRRLFYLMTARLEDAAAVAADGQGADVAKDELGDLVARLHAVGEEVTILADAVTAIVEHAT